MVQKTVEPKLGGSPPCDVGEASSMLHCVASICTAIWCVALDRAGAALCLMRSEKSAFVRVADMDLVKRCRCARLCRSLLRRRSLIKLCVERLFKHRRNLVNESNLPADSAVVPSGIDDVADLAVRLPVGGSDRQTAATPDGPRVRSQCPDPCLRDSSSGRTSASG